MEEVNSKSRLHRIAVQKGEPVNCDGFTGPDDQAEYESEDEAQKAQFLSWKPEVIADGSGKWVGNALRFATKEEAEANAAELASRWIMVRETRAAQSTDPVAHRWQDGQLLFLPK